MNYVTKRIKFLNTTITIREKKLSGIFQRVNTILQELNYKPKVNISNEIYSLSSDVYYFIGEEIFREYNLYWFFERLRSNNYGVENKIYFLNYILQVVISENKNLEYLIERVE